MQKIKTRLILFLLACAAMLGDCAAQTAPGWTTAERERYRDHCKSSALEEFSDAYEITPQIAAAIDTTCICLTGNLETAYARPEDVEERKADQMFEFCVKDSRLFSLLLRQSAARGDAQTWPDSVKQNLADQCMKRPLPVSLPDSLDKQKVCACMIERIVAQFPDYYAFLGRLVDENIDLSALVLLETEHCGKLQIALDKE